MSDYPASIAKAMHEVMSSVGYVQKKGENKFHGYKYAGEANLLEVLRPAMLDAGLMLLPSGVEHSPIDDHGNVHVTMEYTLVHKNGDVWPDKIRAFGSGNDKAKNGSVGDKGTYKAITGANKYLLFKLFQIETGDDPEQAEHPAPQEAAQQQKSAPPTNAQEIKQKTIAWVDMRIAEFKTSQSHEDLDALLENHKEAISRLHKKDEREYERLIKAETSERDRIHQRNAA